MNIIPKNRGLLLLRVGLAAVYVYFGVSQLMAPQMWAGMVPAWRIISFVDPMTIVYMNAIFELIFVLLLAIGVWTKPVSIVLGIHLAIITIAVGWNPIGARDFGLTLATFAHGFWEDR